MNKIQFDLKKQMLFTYMRRGGCCEICGGEVNPQEMTTDREFAAPLSIDDLLALRLMHPFCKAREARRVVAPAAKAA